MKCEEFYRLKLSDQGKAYYDAIKRQLETGGWSGVYVLPVHDRVHATQDSFQAVKALRRDDPRFFFLNRSSQAVIRGNALHLTNSPIYTLDQVKRLYRILNRRLEQLTAGTARLSTWERERVIYQRVATCATYENQHMEADHSVVGLLLRKAGVCEAFADLLTLALRRARIPCIRVSGMGRSERHCWCIGWIDGRPVHLDVTWESTTNGEVGYRYFNLTDREIGIDHQIDTPGLPRCTDPALGFHAMKGLLFQTAGEARGYIRRELWRGKRLVRLRLNQGDVSSVVRQALRWAPFGDYVYRANSGLGTAIICRKR